MGNEPRVNSICFCFPFPFLFFPLPLLSANALEVVSPAGVDDPLAFLLASHAGAGGVVVPKIFRNDWFPLAAPFGTRGAADDGSSGKADLEMTGGVAFTFAPGPGTDVGPRTGVEAATDEPAHGVVRCGWRNPLAAGAGAGTNADASGGKRSGVDGLARDSACIAGLEVEAAARATRSRTWPDDRDAVDCFALRRRPPVMPAHSEPWATGVSSGN